MAAAVVMAVAPKALETPKAPDSPKAPEAPKSVAAKTWDELAVGLATTCRDGCCWQCHDQALLGLCDLRADVFERAVRGWWGVRDLWLDMYATEVAKQLGLRAQLDRRLGSAWVDKVEEWLDATYAAATANITTPPPRNMLQGKSIALVKTVSERLSASAVRQHVGWRKVLTAPVTLVCDQCHKDYSQRIGRCPACFPPKAPPPRKESEAASPEAAQKEWRTLPAAAIDSIDWRQASDVLWCHGGSGGVTLVRLDSQVACFKRSSPAELFAQRLATAVKVRVAPMRLLRSGMNCDEAYQLRQGVRRVAPDVGQDNWLPIRKMMQYEYLAAVQYVNGFGMMGLEAHKHLMEGAAGVWSELGRLMGYDMLINNFDRLPLAWSNEGNLGNVMLGSELGPVVGIDQCVSPITHPDGLELYLGRVRASIHEACDAPGPRFRAVQEAIYCNTGITISSEQMDELRSGCLAFAHEAAALCRNGELDGVLDSVGRGVLDEFGDQAEAAANVQKASSMVAAVAAAFVGAVNA